jgi:hypothetical protein
LRFVGVIDEGESIVRGGCVQADVVAVVVVKVDPDFVTFVALESGIDAMLAFFLLSDPLIMCLAVGDDVVGWEGVINQPEECGEHAVLVPGRGDGGGVICPWSLGEYLTVLLVLSLEFFQHLAVLGIELCNEWLVLLLLFIVLLLFLSVSEGLLPVGPGVFCGRPRGPYGVTGLPFLSDFVDGR